MDYFVNEIKKGGKIAVDDTLLVKDCAATAGSFMLKNFVPLFSAEAVTRLSDAGYDFAGKTNVGEFGLDIMGETSAFGACVDNGSLRGAAAQAVADGAVDAAIGVDLNGAPVRAAAASGVCFIKPTYGTVSRYGVIPCACSGETVGVYAKTAKGAAEILSVIAGHDDKDGTSLPDEKYEYSLDKSVDGMKVCVIKELFDAADGEVQALVKARAEALTGAGAKVEYVSVPEVIAAQRAWNILMCAETCNNISRYDGVKFGHRTADYKDIDELYVKSRTEGFGLLAKETLIYGSDVLSKGRYDVCYDKALRTRGKVCKKLKELFAEYDIALVPAASKKEFAPYDTAKAFTAVYAESLFTAVSSISGTPAVCDCGVQLLSGYFGENKLLSAAALLETKEAKA